MELLTLGEQLSRPYFSTIELVLLCCLMGQPRPLFQLFSSFRTTNIWVASGIRTRIFRAVGESTDH